MSEEVLSARPIWRDTEFARGSRDMVGVSLGIAAWGLVTGVAMVKSGMPLPLCIGLLMDHATPVEPKPLEDKT